MSIRTCLVLCILCVLTWSLPAWSQYHEDEPRDIDSRYPGARPSDFAPPPRYLITAPTASTLPRGHFDITLWDFGDGGVLGATSIGLANRFLIGVSYGAESFLGASDPVWNDRVGFQLKLQLLEEKYKVPAIAVGYDDQGYGPWIDSVSRYVIKSKGAYAVISKNFYTLNIATGFHGGVNYSFEDGDGEQGPDAFLGWDIHYNHEISLLVEYTLGLNDNESGSPVGKGRGFLNMAIRWEYSRQLVLEFILSNLTQNIKNVDNIGRQVRIVYLQEF